MEEKRVPFLYLWIYKKMIDRFGKVNIVVTNRELMEVMGRTFYQIPRVHFYTVLREMSGYGMVEEVNKQKHKIIATGCDARLAILNAYFLW